MLRADIRQFLIVRRSVNEDIMRSRPYVAGRHSLDHVNQRHVHCNRKLPSSESRPDSDNSRSLPGAADAVNGTEKKPDTPSTSSRQTDRRSRKKKEDTRKQQNLKEIWSRTEQAHNTDEVSDSTESAGGGDESEYDDSNAFDSIQENIPRKEQKKKRKRRKKGSTQK